MINASPCGFVQDIETALLRTLTHCSDPLGFQSIAIRDASHMFVFLEIPIMTPVASAE